jgi:hypothetical protein
MDRQGEICIDLANMIYNPKPVVEIDYTFDDESLKYQKCHIEPDELWPRSDDIIDPRD